MPFQTMLLNVLLLTILFFAGPLETQGAPAESSGSSTKDIVIVAKGSKMAGDVKCNGVKDDVKIQAAIVAAIPNNNKVVLSDGTFFLSGNIQIVADGITVEGQGIDKTILKVVAKAPAWSKPGLIGGKEIRDFTLKALTLDGQRTRQKINNSTDTDDKEVRFGFYCSGCTNVKLVGIKVTSFVGYGVNPRGTLSGEFMTEFLLQESIVTDNGYDGIALDKTMNAVVIHNTVTKNGRHGINVMKGSKNVVLSSNRVYDNGDFNQISTPGCGINIVGTPTSKVPDTSNVTLILNDISGNARNPLCVNDAETIRLEENSLRTEVEECARIDSTNDVYMDNNNCFWSYLLVKGTYEKSTYKTLRQPNVFYDGDVEDPTAADFSG